MYRLACFNVLAHNRDDHSKNFAFLMDESGVWKISPAYDLTFSFGPIVNPQVIPAPQTPFAK
jgi:serine/threonine-protein kinase HipA